MLAKSQHKNKNSRRNNNRNSDIESDRIKRQKMVVRIVLGPGLVQCVNNRGINYRGQLRPNYSSNFV